MRDCENCIHHTEKGCSSWNCEFEKKEQENKDNGRKQAHNE